MIYIYNTKEGTEASVTGNVYGVYDMAGGTWEYTAAIYKGGNSNDNRSKLWDSNNSRYVDQYTETTGSQSTYYGNINKYGDAVHEISKDGYSENNSWDFSYSSFPESNGPVFERGGLANDGNTAGIFAFSYSTGEAGNFRSFRPVVICSQ